MLAVLAMFALGAPRVDACAALEPGAEVWKSMENVPDPTGGFQAARKGRFPQAVSALEPWLAGVEREAPAVFGWAQPDWRRAAAFFKSYVYAKKPLVALATEGFRFVDPVPGVMAWACCRAGRWDQAARWLLKSDPRLREPATLESLRALRSVPAH